jgi:hypothetical protein
MVYICHIGFRNLHLGLLPLGSVSVLGPFRRNITLASSCPTDPICGQSSRFMSLLSSLPAPGIPQASPGDAFEDIYYGHMIFLDDLRTDHPNKYHKLMTATCTKVGYVSCYINPH